MEHTELVVLWALTAARFFYVIRRRDWVDSQPAVRETASGD